jgi:hypothetical protein
MNIVISSINPSTVNITTNPRLTVSVVKRFSQTVSVTTPPKQEIDILMAPPKSLSVIGMPGEEGPPGPMGPQGPPGPPGGGYFHFVQPTPSGTWTITHSLGYYPNVTVVDSAYQVVIPEVTYTSTTQLVLSFSAAVAGEAYLS